VNVSFYNKDQMNPEGYEKITIKGSWTKKEKT